MRSFPLIVIIVPLLVMLLGTASPAASADPPDQTTPLALKSAPLKKTARNIRRWARKKKMFTAVVLGCVIATAIAVPVAVGVHHEVEVRHQDRLRNVFELLVSDREIVVSRVEQRIQNLLHDGPTASIAQQAILKTRLALLQQDQHDLNQAYTDLVLRKPLSAAAAYYIIPTENLPILNPLRDLPLAGNHLADLLQPDLAVLVDLGRL